MHSAHSSSLLGAQRSYHFPFFIYLIFIFGCVILFFNIYLLIYFLFWLSGLRNWTRVLCIARPITGPLGKFRYHFKSLYLTSCFTHSISNPYNSLVVCCSVTKLCPTLWDPMTAAHQASMSFTISWSFLKLMSIESVMPSNHLILRRPRLLIPSIFPSIRVFSSESTLHLRWLKYWSFSFNISPSNEYSGLISGRIDSFDILAVKQTLKSLLQLHSLKASIL